MPSQQDQEIARAAQAAARKGRKKPTIKQTNRTSLRRKRNKVLYSESMRFAREIGIELAPDTPIADVLRKTFNRTHALWVHAATMVDSLDPDAKTGTPESLWTYKWDDAGNKLVEPQKWVQYERELRRELFEQAAVMQKLNIDEAAVRIEGMKLHLLQQALKASMRQANVPEDMQRRIGAALRQELTQLEASGTSPQESDISSDTSSTTQIEQAA